MNNSDKSTNNKRWSQLQRRSGRGSNNNQRQNNYRARGKEKRRFPKFADTAHNDKGPYYRSQNPFTTDYERNDICVSKCSGSASDAGIYTWVRRTPVNPLILPQHKNFDDQRDESEHATNSNTNLKSDHIEHLIESQKKPQEENIYQIENNSVPKINPTPEGLQILNLHTEQNNAFKIKEEKDILINLKQERKSSSSSTSSESSSDEEETQQQRKTDGLSKNSTNSIQPSSSLNIKLKPKASAINSTPVKVSNEVTTLPEHSSTSTSSSEEELPVAEENIEVLKNDKTKSQNENRLEDVVCMGNLENNILLEEGEIFEVHEETTAKNFKKKSKNLDKKAAEICMICDKKGHTSFQCQLICKNCSAPYHGYRTCPKPANLNTMLQLFVEFCMQQFQNFNAEKPIATNVPDSLPKSKVDNPRLISASSKPSKLKREQVKTNENNKKNKISKKRKLFSAKRQKSNTDCNDSSDDDKEDDKYSDTTSTESEDEVSNSTAESLVSSKKRRKIKSKNNSTAALNLSNFSTNPINIPVVLNGFPNLTVPATSVQNPNASANALNTLLLTQMFQNAIGSLKQ